MSHVNHHLDPLQCLDEAPSSKPKKWYIKFIIHYFALTACTFGVLLFLTNFSAYTDRVMYWIHPEAMMAEENSIRSLLSSSSLEVHASEWLEAREDSLEVLTEKISEKMPELIYETAENPARLLAHVDDDSASVSFDIVPYENRIIIPKLGKNIPLVDVSVGNNFDFDHMENIFMKELQKGIVRYPGTAQPGQVGNSFIFGHSSNYPWIQSEYNDVFSLLDTLAENDEIIVYYRQNKYTYRVTDKKVVKPGDVKALEWRDPNKKELSLMTCWPIGTTLNRMIVFTELVEESNSNLAFTP
jgi:LPXTG-site transpeptidase (sortase) family protein